MHELAYGVTSINPVFGPVLNPYDVTKIPGGVYSHRQNCILVTSSICVPDWYAG